ncbi:MAG: DUF2284 domain-containing protein [Clostridia bacterium]|nr:DUF2284 domain-containing protein [Clostridia bacterium]MBQ9408302.1 DUF2284 domain-containing protein [Clostridia bacterium]
MAIREQIMQSAKELGIYECGFVDAKEIGVSPMVRTLCEKNACGAYGKSWACPPGVGTIEECAQRLHSYTTAFVFSTRHELEDSYDFEGMMEGKNVHNAMAPGVVDFFRQRVNGPMLVLSTEGCAKCAKCTYPDAPCRFPESLHPSIESYGVEVNVLATKAGIRYHNGKNTVTYHSCILFNEDERKL